MKIKPLIQIQPNDFQDCRLTLFTEESSASGEMFQKDDNYYIMQTDVGYILGYKRGDCCVYNSPFVQKFVYNGRKQAFIKLSDCLEFIYDLPCKGNKKARVRTLAKSIKLLSNIINTQFDPIGEIKNTFQVIEIEQKDDLEQKYKELQSKYNELKTDLEQMRESYSNFVGKTRHMYIDTVAHLNAVASDKVRERCLALLDALGGKNHVIS